MGIYIKSMEMPKSCDMCWALDDYGDYPRCRITEEQRGYNFPIREKRMDDCPFIPVPEHGRLIDADELEYEEAYLNGHYELGDVEIVTREDIESAPTIIPADKEDTNG